MFSAAQPTDSGRNETSGRPDRHVGRERGAQAIFGIEVQALTRRAIDQGVVPGSWLQVESHIQMQLREAGADGDHSQPWTALPISMATDPVPWSVLPLPLAVQPNLVATGTVAFAPHRAEPVAQRR